MFLNLLNLNLKLITMSHYKGYHAENPNSNRNKRKYKKGVVEKTLNKVPETLLRNLLSAQPITITKTLVSKMKML